MKGAVPWLLVVMGLFLITMLLIFSLAFSQTTILSRETLDQNVLFEGDEVETYARSLTNSIQISTAQAIYDFYSANKDDVWQEYDSKTVPTPEIAGSIEYYMSLFLQKHQDFTGENSGITIGQDIGNAQVDIEDRKIDVKFEEDFAIEKTFFRSSYARTFAAESTLVTVFGMMMREIKDELIQKEMVKTAVLKGIGKEGENDPVTCEKPMRDGATELRYYIDDDTSGSREKVSQTVTKGTMGYCSTSKKTFSCGQSKPNEKSGSPRSQPSSSEVYQETHGITMENGKVKIQSDVRIQLACLETMLDHKSTDYTVAFDESPSIPVETAIVSSSSEVEDDGYCSCESDPCGVGDRRWTCNEYKRVTYTYDHEAEANVQVRFQEDGFVYGFWEGENPAADSIKLVFRVISGNMR
jgi:hypothetical protein